MGSPTLTMPTVTALRDEGRGRVGVDLDGTRWRTMPLVAVVKAGIGVGVELDRPRARCLRRELRRSDALATAGRALSRRDLPLQSLDRRLERAGVAPATRTEAIDALARAGLVDDQRFAVSRAEALAARGRGDAAIRWDLERQGVSAEEIERAVAALEPERERAQAIAERQGRTPKTARSLSRNGFADDSVEAALGTVAQEGPGALG
jgi:SOS response regulatory protein OraA/RecX